MADGTIIVGKLKDDELRKSIDELVKYVDKAATDMKKSFDTNLQGIEGLFKNLGNLSSAATTATTQGTEKRIANANKEVQAAKSVEQSYNSLAIAQKKVAETSSAKDSLYTFVQSYREAAAKAMIEIKSIQNTSLDKQLIEYERWEKEIKSVENQIKNLKNELASMPNATRFDVQAYEQQIAILEKKLKDLVFSQISSTKQIENADNARIAELQKSYDSLIAKIRELTIAERQRATSTTQAQQQYTNEIRRQAEEIKKSAEFQKTGIANVYNTKGEIIGAVYNKKNVDVEEQLLQIYKQQVAETEKLSSTQNSVADKERERLQLEQQLNTAITEGQKTLDMIAKNPKFVDQNTITSVTESLRNAEHAARQLGQVDLATKFGTALNSIEATGKAASNASKEFQSLRQVMAGHLNIMEDQVKLADTETDSYNKLKTTLSQLTSTYQNMSASERNGEWGKSIVASIREVEQAMQQIKQTMARPIDLKQVMMLPEKTLDDIAYKIRQLQTYMNGLDTTKQKDEIQKVVQAMNELKKKQDEVIGNNGKWAKSNSEVNKTLSYIQRRLTYMVSVFGSMNFVKSIIEVRGQYEMLERSIGVLVDSAQKGSEIFKELNSMALNSPFTTIQLGEAARQLTAYGIEANQVVDVTRRLADIASAVGAPIDRIAYALGQVQTYGYLTSIQSKSFMRMGIPLIKELADHYTQLEGRVVSTADVYDRMKKKAISYNDVLQIINRDTEMGGRFFNYQAKMAETLKIRLANLNLAWNNMLNEIGKANQGVLVGSIKLLSNLIKNWRSFSNMLYAVGTVYAGAVIAGLLGIQTGLVGVTAGVTALRSAMALLSRAFTWVMANPIVAAFTIIAGVLIKLGRDALDAKDRVDSLNKSLTDGAKEASDKYGDLITKMQELGNIKIENGEIKVTANTEDTVNSYKEVRQTILDMGKSGELVINNIEKNFTNVRDRLSESTKYLRDARDITNKLAGTTNKQFIVNDNAVKSLKQYNNVLYEIHKKIEDINKSNPEGKWMGVEVTDINSWINAVEEYKKHITEIDGITPSNSLQDSYELAQKNIETVFDQAADSLIARWESLGLKLGNTTGDQFRIAFNQDVERMIQEQNIELQDQASYRIAMEQAIIRRMNAAWADYYNSSDQKNRELVQKQQSEWNKGFGQGKVAFEEFWSFVQKVAGTKIQQMAEKGIDSSTWVMGEGKMMINEWLDLFLKNNGIAYMDMQDKVALMNQMSVVIKVWYREMNSISNFKKEAAELYDVPETAIGSAKDYAELLSNARTQVDKLTTDIKNLEGMSKDKRPTNYQQQLDSKKEELKYQQQILDKNNLQSKGQIKATKDAQKAEDNARKAREKAQRAAEAARRKEEEQRRKEEEELKKALSDEIHLIDGVRSSYEKLRKSGYTAETSAIKLSENYGKMIESVNASLTKYGVKGFSMDNILNPDTKALKSYKEIYDYLDGQLVTLEASSRVTRDAVKTIADEIRKLYEEMAVDAMEVIEYNFEKSMDKLNEDYDMSVTLQDTPELADLFGDMLGIDVGEVLKDAPKTLRQYMDEVNRISATAVNDMLAKNLSTDFVLPSDFNILDDNWWKSFTESLGKEGIDSAIYKDLEKYRNDLIKKLEKDYTDTIKQWETLVDKYGEIQDRIVKITRDSLAEQIGIIKKFAPAKELEAISLVGKIRMSNDPAEVEALKQQFEDLLIQAIGDNPKAQSVLDASMHKMNENISKAIWDDFKGQPLYATLFDDLGRASTSAIQKLKNEMDGLKDSIKDSPESMKALMSAYQKLREELIKRDPFGWMIQSMKDYKAASHEVIDAENKLKVATQEEQEAREKLDNALIKNPKNLREIQKLTAQYNKKVKARRQAEGELLTVQNRVQETQEYYNKSIDEAGKHISNLASSIKAVGSALGDTGGEVFNFIGDIMNFAVTCSKAIQFTATSADSAIRAIESASVILTVISAAIQLLKQLNNFLPNSDSEYEKTAKKQANINKLADAVRDYRLAVLEARTEEENWFGTNNLKQLKNFYAQGSAAMEAYYEKMNEEQAIYQNKSGGGWLTNFAHWTNPATWIQKLTGGKMNNTWAQALGLVASATFGVAGVVAQAGLQLTDSAGKFHEYAEGYTAAINNLRIETRKARKGFLGSGIGGKSQKTQDLISWVKEQLGLDLFDPETGLLNMEAYDQLMEKYEKKLVGETKATLEALHDYAEQWNEYIDKLREYVDQMYSPLVENMTDAMWEWYDNGTNALDNFKEYASDTFRNIVTDMMKTIILSNFAEAYAEDIKKMYEKYSSGEMTEEQLLRYVASRTGQMMSEYQANIPLLENIMMTATDVLRQYGINLAQGSTELSALQQGIQGITETTANALEAYMNGVSQQVYYQSDLLTQIRDAIILYDFSLQSSINAEILLSLQQSYQVQMAIQATLTNWSSADGLSVRVEMI